MDGCLGTLLSKCFLCFRSSLQLQYLEHISHFSIIYFSFRFVYSYSDNKLILIVKLKTEPNEM